MRDKKYGRLLEDRDIKRWYDDVARGSRITADTYLRRLGNLQESFSINPKEIIRKDPKRIRNAIMDLVSDMEGKGNTGSYIESVVKAVKSWLAYNDIEIRRIKISRAREAPTLQNERIPNREELAKILDMKDIRAKVAISLIAFGGQRLEVLGSYKGNDGLEVRDFPEMKVKAGKVDFEKIPTHFRVRNTLSKAGHEYVSFIPEQACTYVRNYLEMRMKMGEKVGENTAIITQNWNRAEAGRHIATPNVSDLIRNAIRAAGYAWRPYVFRRYYDTKMTIDSVADGLILRDFVTFFVGHRGDIEHTYTLHKAIPADMLERMREMYAKAADKHLVTRRNEAGLTEQQVKDTVREQLLLYSGFDEKEIKSLGDVSLLTAEQLQEMIRRKSMQSLGLNNGNHQKIVPMGELRVRISEGWEFVRELTDGDVIIRLPSVN